MDVNTLELQIQESGTLWLNRRVRHSRESGNLKIGRFSRSAAAWLPQRHLESPVGA